MKRIKLKLKKPNPLFEIWLEEWRKEAASRNSDLQYHFSKALQSLRKYPLPLKSGKDCIILQHFGTKLCSMLDRKLEEYKARNEGSTSAKDFVCKQSNYEEQHVLKRKYKSQQIVMDADFEHERTELAAFDNLNLSSWNLENYAALFILYKNTQNPHCSGYITEVDLLSEIKELCGDVSKTSVLDLFQCGLISMIGAPNRYNLTEHGVNISKNMCEVTTIDVESINSINILSKIQALLKPLFIQKSELTKDFKNLDNGNTNTQLSKNCSNGTQSNSTKPSKMYKSKSEGFSAIRKHRQQPEKDSVRQKSEENNMLVEKIPGRIKKAQNTNNGALNNIDNNKTDSTNNIQKNIYLESNKFDVILLVDTHETSGGRTKPQHDATVVELTQLGVIFEIRHLKVGDFAWVARCRNTKNELILPYIIERKRIDDLSSSITDGRFHEQKFRLKQCGITNLMYIIEEYEKGQKLAIPYSSLMQASINTLIQDGFSVKYTKSHKDSMFYLSSLTRVLIRRFREKNLICCKKEAIAQINILSDTCFLMEFEEFNKAASKQKVFKVSQMFVRQLLQLKGISVDKALAIVERYPTPRVLIEAFQNSDCNESLLAKIEFGDKKRLIGPIISKTIYQLYTKKNLD
ncbi:PREDICTED: crossover junction endonuclease MUS81 [Habropoda laboriosa]|uniref:crossover junction endonuclease MUS81 n=1 Tax=Habropoda laboriosa TaxID=597456 RepID=UPI00083E3F0F|nr:PREDICTED: crossover junction endonuclease MUS81 [Habropoda laboriosa]